MIGSLDLQYLLAWVLLIAAAIALVLFVLLPNGRGTRIKRDRPAPAKRRTKERLASLEGGLRVLQDRVDRMEGRLGPLSAPTLKLGESHSVARGTTSRQEAGANAEHKGPPEDTRALEQTLGAGLPSTRDQEAQADGTLPRDSRTGAPENQVRFESVIDRLPPPPPPVPKLAELWSQMAWDGSGLPEHAEAWHILQMRIHDKGGDVKVDLKSSFALAQETRGGEVSLLPYLGRDSNDYPEEFFTVVPSPEVEQQRLEKPASVVFRDPNDDLETAATKITTGRARLNSVLKLSTKGKIVVPIGR
jgi:hypothetical protein